MAQSQDDLRREIKVRREGYDQGYKEGHAGGLAEAHVKYKRATILMIMTMRYGEIDTALEQTSWRLMLMSRDWLGPLTNLSKEELIQHCLEQKFSFCYD